MKERRRANKARMALSGALAGGPRVGVFSNKYGSRLVRITDAIEAPHTLCLDTNYEETVAFFHDLRVHTRMPSRGALMPPSGRRPARIGWVRGLRDMTTLKSISAGAALILASEYDRVGRVYGFPPVTIDLHRWDPYVCTTLSRLGFFELLELEPYKNEPADAIIIKPMVCNSQAKGSEAIEHVKELFSEVGGQKSVRIDLSSGVIDAIENAVDHAYPEDWPEVRWRAPLWWFTGAADPSNQKMTLAIYDHGITIPVSLPKKWSVGHLTQIAQALFKLPFRPDDPTFDAQAIDTAMAIGATSTGQEFRGKGLAKMKDLISRCPSGQLRIVSGYGECVYGADGSKLIRNHPTPLPGTYVQLEASFGNED